MKRRPCAILLFWLVLLAQQSIYAQQRRERSFTPSEISQIAIRSVVALQAEDSKTIYYGSGFFVRENLIATNYHVVKDAFRISARLVGHDTEYLCMLVGKDEASDLAVLRVQSFSAPALTLSPIPSKVGEEIYVISNPKEYEGTFTRGLVNAYRVNGEIQIDAPVSHGSSGGPVLNRHGQVIAVVRESEVNGQNLNFAVPASSLKSLLTHLEAVGALAGQNSFDPLGIDQFLESQGAGASTAVGAARLADEIKRLAALLHWLGGIAKELRDIDDAVKRDQASRAAIDYANARKIELRTSLRSLAEDLDKLEKDFKTKSKWTPYYAKIFGVAELGANAEQQAAQGQFDKVGRVLLEVFNQLVDTLHDIR